MAFLFRAWTRWSSGAVLIGLLTTLNPAIADHDVVYRLRREGKILPLSEFIGRAQAIHPGELLEAELEERRGRYVYEIEIAGEDGRFYEIYFDAATGELLNTVGE